MRRNPDDPMNHQSDGSATDVHGCPQIALLCGTADRFVWVVGLCGVDKPCFKVHSNTTIRHKLSDDRVVAGLRPALSLGSCHCSGSNNGCGSKSALAYSGCFGCPSFVSPRCFTNSCSRSCRTSWARLAHFGCGQLE